MANFVKYLAKRAATRPLQHGPETGADLRQAIIIPALDERATLPLTLASLAANPPALLAQTLVVVVVNNRPAMDSNPTPTPENAATLTWLAAAAAQSPLRLAWIDAATPGHELPAWGGVGLARRLGCDSVLAALHANTPEALRDVVIFSLDADTLVEPSYLAAAAEFRASGKAGGVLPFRHQPADSPELQAAIDAYECYLHYYVDGLRWAGSPYAFHTVGSCMLCTADAYVAASGFPARRQAGEDFYFCQELAKTGGICELRSSMVHPSPRLSRRVPFGTGPRMAEAVLEGHRDFVAYDARCFAVLRQVLAAAVAGLDTDAATVLAGLATEPLAQQFLLARGFPETWGQFQRQFRTREARLAAFHRWFDGFTTLKLIHHLTEQKWPRVPLRDAVLAMQRQE